MFMVAGNLLDAAIALITLQGVFCKTICVMNRSGNPEYDLTLRLSLFLVLFWVAWCLRQTSYNIVPHCIVLQ